MTELSVVKKQEAALLGAVMRDGAIYEQAREIVVSQNFHTQVFAWAWDAFETLYSNGMGIDVITTGDELERAGRMDDFSESGLQGRALLSRVRENGDPRNWMAYAENVNDYAAKRQITAFLSEGAEWAANGRRAKDIIQDMSTSFSKVTIYGAADEYTVPLSAAVLEAGDWTTRAAKGELVGIPTGLMDIDQLLGGLFKQNIYLLAARPGQGKTAFLLQVAAHAAGIGKRVGAFILESGRVAATHRLIAQAGKINVSHLKTGKLTPQEWERYPDAMDKVAKLPIIINDLSNININQIRQTARKIKATGGLDLLVLDYIQLAQPADKKRNGTREQDVSQVSAGLKYLARELDIPILAAAQLSRAPEQRKESRPVLSDLRESGSLEQDAYAVVFLYASDPYEKTANGQRATEAIIAKHRDGEVGTVPLVFRGPFVTFENGVSQNRSFEQEDK